MKSLSVVFALFLALLSFNCASIKGYKYPVDKAMYIWEVETIQHSIHTTYFTLMEPNAFYIGYPTRYNDDIQIEDSISFVIYFQDVRGKDIYIVPTNLRFDLHKYSVDADPEEYFLKVKEMKIYYSQTK